MRMKISGKRIMGMLLVLCLTIPLVGAGSAKGSVKLDLDEYHKSGNAAVSATGTAKSIHDGKITYVIPDSMEKIDAKDIFNEHIYNEGDGELYLVNDAIFGIFYFDSDYFVEEFDEKDETRAIERAIISNICPDEEKNLRWNSLTLKHYTYPTSQSTSRSGLKFDHYVGKYQNFRTEFAFTPAGNGLCVILFIYNHDATSATPPISVIESIKIGV